MLRNNSWPERYRRCSTECQMLISENFFFTISPSLRRQNMFSNDFTMKDKAITEGDNKSEQKVYATERGSLNCRLSRLMVWFLIGARRIGVVGVFYGLTVNCILTSRCRFAYVNCPMKYLADILIVTLCIRYSSGIECDVLCHFTSCQLYLLTHFHSRPCTLQADKSIPI